MDEISLSVQKTGNTIPDTRSTTGYSVSTIKDSLPITTDQLLLEKINAASSFKEISDSNMQEFNVDKQAINDSIESLRQDIVSNKIVERLDVAIQIRQLENQIRNTTKQNIKSAADIYTYPITPMQAEQWISDNTIQPQIQKPDIPDLPLNY